MKQCELILQLLPIVAPGNTIVYCHITVLSPIFFDWTSEVG
jgi:hypothetical protein